MSKQLCVQRPKQDHTCTIMGTVGQMSVPSTIRKEVLVLETQARR